VTLDRTFVDKASGKDVARPELEAMVGFVRDGDTVVCHSMDRLARNLDALGSIVRTLTAKGVQVHFVKEQLTSTGEDTAVANLLLSVMGAFAEFERSLIRERQREGIELAKARGAYRGRKRSLSDDQVAELRRRVEDGVYRRRCSLGSSASAGRRSTRPCAPPREALAPGRVRASPSPRRRCPYRAPLRESSPGTLYGTPSRGHPL